MTFSRINTSAATLTKNRTEGLPNVFGAALVTEVDMEVAFHGQRLLLCWR